MITKIYVDGFKSLSKFKLNLRQGLNILVGPNGAGKTNIIQFFEFLSNLTENSIGNAVSMSGGAGSVFRKIGLNEYQNELSFCIYGSIRLASKKFLTYEYRGNISASFDTDVIHFSSQSIKFKIGSKFWEDPDAPLYLRGNWDLDLEYKQVDGKAKVNLKTINEKKIIFRFFENIKESENESNFENFIKSHNPAFNNILNSLFILLEDYQFQILKDLLGGETFNVVPSKVKDIEDAATPPGIKKDGSGLSTTLYSMKNSKPRERLTSKLGFFYYKGEQNYDPNTLKQIVSYLKLANKTIENLDVVNDPFDNKLIVKVYIETEEYQSVLPLAAMSDGTIKWLALITAILTSKTIFSIEEPENFLHPWMQAEIANIMREHILNKKNESFILMTTHSESLLNHSNPKEILLVDNKHGNTVAKRISNSEEVISEISNSGFGLGHFYFSNVLDIDNEDN
ncbi:AAA family ATPase [Sphingobacterium multivorum]|uniref:AAA family ATPase n=1 Tax=Sphingobacterium multivorum TaxID=28454 RepID=UPI00345E8EBA